MFVPLIAHAKRINCFWHLGPGHYRLRQFPQDVAWASAMRYAQKTVFMFVPCPFVVLEECVLSLHIYTVKRRRSMLPLLSPVFHAAVHAPPSPSIVYAKLDLLTHPRLVISQFVLSPQTHHVTAAAPASEGLLSRALRALRNNAPASTNSFLLSALPDGPPPTPKSDREGQVAVRHDLESSQAGPLDSAPLLTFEDTTPVFAMSSSMAVFEPLPDKPEELPPARPMDKATSPPPPTLKVMQCPVRHIIAMLLVPLQPRVPMTLATTENTSNESTREGRILTPPAGVTMGYALGLKGPNLSDTRHTRHLKSVLSQWLSYHVAHDACNMLAGWTTYCL